MGTENIIKICTSEKRGTHLLEGKLDHLHLMCVNKKCVIRHMETRAIATIHKSQLLENKMITNECG